jgi:hypothetical protein
MTENLKYVQINKYVYLADGGEGTEIQKGETPLEAALRIKKDSKSKVKKEVRKIQYKRVGDFVLKEGKLYYKDELAEPFLYFQFLSALRESGNIDKVLKFLEKCEQCDSYFVRNELWKFMNTNEMTINNNGNIRAYKKVRSDYFDIHSHTVRYMPGDVPTMAKNKVDNNRENTCSYGLHFCSLDYLAHFGGYEGEHTMEVEVDPRDVVSIPVDYNNKKGRASRIGVIRELSEEELRKPPKMSRDEIEELIEKFC